MKKWYAMKCRIPLAAALLALLLTGCNKLDEANSMTIQTGQSGKNYVVPIGSVFVGGGTADITKGSTHRASFFQEKLTLESDWNDVKLVASINGFWHTGVDYTNPGRCIDEINLHNLDESLGLGSSIKIPMNQGKYEGGNEKIKSVVILSYKFSSYTGDTPNKDADIRIFITTKAGDTITIHFVNDITQFDGYD